MHMDQQANGGPQVGNAELNTSWAHTRQNK